MDYVAAFKAVFENREFHTFMEFQECLDKYMNDVGVIYARGTSKKSSNWLLKYQKIFYRCIKYKRRKSESRGIRRARSEDVCCKSRFHVVKRNACLVVSSFDLEHNHPISRLAFESHPMNRRLTVSELIDSRNLFEYNAPTADIKRYVADVYGKLITTTDVQNIRHKLKSTVPRNSRIPQRSTSSLKSSLTRPIYDYGDGSSMPGPHSIFCKSHTRSGRKLRRPTICKDCDH
ncbi:hypothetical protein EG68_12267 [Paragonimus skrjabini miyazakii]|uniref:FAR1 domain-containing protein n=1 Tax=Paragonimus skrjabini miyazakii TaxID=59628 RepID=A0A8S9YIE5_9TREM|nr:hypothetical protein EG68_12267 [Paragonimus skrjabini miyazakii]